VIKNYVFRNIEGGRRDSRREAEDGAGNGRELIGEVGGEGGKWERLT
jgi:hypothetical protein